MLHLELPPFREDGLFQIQILNPGTNTPVGYLAVSLSLCRLTKEIAYTIYVETPGSPNVSLPKVAELIAALQQWLNSVPSHLKWGASLAPSHRRPIGILHLRYWSSMMLATRPFLLYTVLRGAQLSSPEKRKWFDDLGATCISAADHCLTILKVMGNEGILSSLTTFECNCVLEVIMISLLALAKHNLPRYRANIKLAMDVLRSMEQIGWCRKALKELNRQVSVLGIEDAADAGQQENTMGEEYDNTSLSPEQQDFNLLVSTSPPVTDDDSPDHCDRGSNVSSGLGGLDALDVFFGDLFPAEMDMADSTPMNMFQQITDFSRSITTST